MQQPQYTQYPLYNPNNGLLFSTLQGLLATNMAEQLPQNNLDATSSAWEFQFQASELTIMSEADKRDR